MDFCNSFIDLEKAEISQIIYNAWTGGFDLIYNVRTEIDIFFKKEITLSLTCYGDQYYQNGNNGHVGSHN